MERSLRLLIIYVIAGVITLGSTISVAEEKHNEARKIVQLKEVVVSATRTPTPSEEVGSSITVITREEIEAKSQVTVDDVLKGTLGVDIRATGGPGSSSFVSLRGAKPFQTLILIDGLEMNDPTGPNRGFNFSNLTVDNIERIEILRGPQSPLYGADAMGGVINIITKKGKDAPRVYFGAERGSYDTWREFGGVSGGNDWLNISLALSHNSGDGFSAADDDLAGNTEDDKWENTSASTRVGFVLSEQVNLDFMTRFQKGRTHLDNGGGPFYDQQDYHVKETKVFTRSQINATAFDGMWEQTLAYGFADHSRDNRKSPWGDTEYDGRKHEISWQNDFYLHETNMATFGVEYERETVDDHAGLNESVYTTSFFIQDQIKLKDFSFTTFGVRYDNHNEFGGETTFRITQAFVLRDCGTRLRGSYGTGFRAPSLYELYAPPLWGPVGNPNLNPEKSKGFDLGVEQAFFDDTVSAGIAYFYNDFDGLIDFDWTVGYVNLAEAKAQGLESFIKVTPINDLSLSINYTYTDTEDDEGKRQLRSPLHKIGFNTHYRFLNRGTLNLDVLFVGKRNDVSVDAFTFITTDVMTNEYVVVNLAGSYDISEHV
ncbi:MAG: TonB-dependent receptor, partial [Thermodesulfobacteriota bacterium]|nr:TonB-dependent receptor [Thermodesulfobacteriota bacterium]